ncbi:MAG: hypothetical protein AB1646_16200 [Thermodesulfobacteriota bacterium]
MWKDPIVEEVREAREEHAARFGYDLKAIYDDLKETEKQTNRKVVSLQPKRPRKEASASVSL